MANLNLNKVVLGGRLTADPELKTTAGGTAVCSFTVAVNRRYKAESGEPLTDFINCVAWRERAEFVSKYFKKGSSICITGSIQTRKWDDSEGRTRYATEVIADEASFVDSKAESGQKAEEAKLPGQFTPQDLDRYNAAKNAPQTVPVTPPKEWQDVDNESGLPF